MAKQNKNNKSGKDGNVFDNKVSKKARADEILADKQRLKSLDEEWKRLKDIAEEFNDLEEKKKKGLKIDEKRLQELRDEYKSVEKLDQKVARLGNNWNKLSEKIQPFIDRIQESLDLTEELDTSFISLSSGISKLPGGFEAFEKKIGTTKKVLGSITTILTDATDLTKNQIELAIEAGQAYGGMVSTVAQMQKKLQKGQITQEQYNSYVESAYENFEDLVDKIDDSTESGKELKEQLIAAKNETEEFAKSAKKTQQRLEAFNTAMDELSSSGIPAANELSSIFKNLANKDFKAAKLGVLALGAAIGKVAGDYFAAPWQVDIEFRNQRIENQMNALRQAGVIQVEFEAKGGAKGALAQIQKDGREGASMMTGIINNAAKQSAEINNGRLKSAEEISTRDLFLLKERRQIDLEYAQASLDNATDVGNVKKKLELERQKAEIDHEEEILKLENDAKFAAEKAANAFNASMRSAAAEFRAASKTALFGNKLGGVGYGAAQLQMAGISADKIAESMTAASSATGKMPTAAAAADMAIMAQRTGQSVDSIAEINSFFQRTDKVTADVAMNLQEGMRALADNAGISLGKLMQEVAEASKDALSYQIKSGKALAKQVAYANSLGINFGDIAKAGKSMVMNYKDSIKAEMQLSTLLGEQVDLSEVRAKFAEGDTKGALEALKAQGLNPEDMDMFQQEALSQALGGMDLSSLQKIATGTGKTGDLTAGKAGAANKDFLSRSVSAQASLSAEQAQISADQAIIDAKTSEKALQEYLKNPKVEDVRKKAIQQQLKEEENEAEQRKLKLNNALSDEIQGRQKFINELNLAYETLVSNMETTNPLIRQAAIEQKKFQTEKTVTEGLVGTGSAIGGTLIANKLQKTFSKKAGQSVEKQVISTGQKEAQEQILKSGEKSFIQATEKAGIASVEKAGMKALSKNILGAGVMTFLGMSVMGGTGGEGSGSPVGLDPNQYANATASQENAETINNSEMSTGFSNLCSCISALGVPLSELPGLNKIMERQAGYSEYIANAQDQLQTVGLIQAGMGAVVTPMAEATMNATLAAGKQTLANAAEAMGGKAVTQTMGKAILSSVTSGRALGGMGLGAGGAVLSAVGDMKKNMAKLTGSMEDLNTGRWLDVAGKAAQGASFGMMLGPIGAAVGGAIGAGFGIFQNFFSSQSEEEKRAVEERKKQIERAEQNKAAIEELIAINEEAAVQAAESRKQQESLMTIAANEEIWRASMLAQTIQMTDLLDLIAFKDAESQANSVSGIFGVNADGSSMTEEQKQKAKNTYTIGGRTVVRKSTDQSKQIAAGYGYDTSGGLSERLTNIMSSQQALAQGGTGTIKVGGKDMTWAEYTKTYKVSNDELKQIAEYQQLQQTLADAKAKGRGPQPQVGADGKPVVTTGGQATTTATATATPATTTTATAAAPTTVGATAAAPAAPTPAIPPATEATLLLIQTQADTRGIILASKMDIMITSFGLMNASLTTISMNMANSLLKLDSIVQNMGDTGGSKLMETVAAATDFTAKNSSNVGKNNYATALNSTKILTEERTNNAKLTQLNIQTAQMVQINKNIQALLGVLAHEGKAATQLIIDGKSVANMLERRNDNRQAGSPPIPS